MKKFITVGLCVIARFAFAQTDSIQLYKKSIVMIPMRDGIKLYTVIMTPIKLDISVPILLNRTPYNQLNPGSLVSIGNDTFKLRDPSWWLLPINLLKDGCIYVLQHSRGRNKSEGTVQLHQPLIHAEQKGAVDESTDTWDTIEWLIKNTSKNNGRVGLWGHSYPGWLALVGSVDPHPALKAVWELACMADLFLGDDFHHNGAFRLSYSLEYSYSQDSGEEFIFSQYDLYDWFLNLGSLKKVNEKYFHNKIPTWNSFVQHPNYDSYWQKNSPLNYIHYPQIPIMHQGGYYDQEDINGPQLMYEHLERKDSFNRNYIILGPWNHSLSSIPKTDTLGKFSFQPPPVTRLNVEIFNEWWDYWLKGIGDGKFEESYCYQTGTEVWKTYNLWPPKEAIIRNLYVGKNNTCSFTKPVDKIGFTKYLSDPSKPVPYRTLPIEATHGPGSRWFDWQIEDQRFVYSRPDVVSFTSDSLTDDLIVTGKITAHVFASTTGTDADWIVKLIDVYPNFDQKNLLMSQYQLPVAMEVFRGRFRKSFEKPQPLTPNKPEEFVIDLHQINHAFKKGHRLMIQIQSTWFPVIDRNPQKYIPNIFEANESDFIKATHTIYFSAQYPTHIALPIMKK